MNPHFERAELLYHQSRYDVAEEQLRLALADEPDLAQAHGYLALCMVEREAFKEATEEARQAVALAPDLSFSHYVLASVSLSRNRLEEAEEAAKRAIEIDPYDANLHQTLAAVYVAQSHWSAALEQADEGLRQNPEHVGCANVRGMALVKLGRKSEAQAVIEGVLARDPEDAFSHANQGWTALHQNEPRKALDCFREALRLDPNLQFAQAGMIEALKAEYFVYRLMLRWFLWMSNLGARWQWGVILVLFFGTKFVRITAENNPKLAPFLWPIFYAMVGFALLTWVADPLFNLMLRLNRYGKHILKRAQIWAANLTGFFAVAAIIFLIIGLTRSQLLYGEFFTLMALVAGLYLIVIAAVFKIPSGPRQWAMSVGAVALLGVAAYAFWLMFAAVGQQLVIGKEMVQDGMSYLTTLYFPGVLIFSIAANVLMQIRQER